MSMHGRQLSTSPGRAGQVQGVQSQDLLVPLFLVQPQGYIKVLVRLVHDLHRTYLQLCSAVWSPQSMRSAAVRRLRVLLETVLLAHR